MVEDKKYLDVGKNAALEIGKVILKYFNNNNFKVHDKDDKTLVTEADIEAEEKFIEIIKTNFPDHGIHGEETGAHENDSEYCWTIDPIDGTSAFINSESNFCINIALLKNNNSILGIIYNPVTNELFTTFNGNSELNGTRIPILKRERLKNSNLNYHLSKDNCKDLNILLTLWRNGEIEKITDKGGSPAYNLALVAKGAHSHFIMYCYKEPSLEDYSSPVLLIRNSGGIVTDISGRDIDPLTHKGYLIASSDSETHKELLTKLEYYGFGSSDEPGKIIFIGGFYGTGKSTLAIKLEEFFGFKRFNSDITRREFNLGNYNENDSEVIWGTIFWKIGKILEEKKGVILESNFLNEDQRKPDFDLAKSKDAQAVFIEVICPEDIAKSRIKSRPLSPDGIHVPTNRIEYYDKKKDLWEPIIPGLMKPGRENISYLIYDSNRDLLYEGLIRENHKEFVKEISEKTGLNILPKNADIINNTKRYDIR